MRFSLNGQSWNERCKCGNTVWVDCKFIVEGMNSPSITKHWYNKDGNLLKITGGKNNN
jgi:hypothetical protein